jgi:hypothetical protein
MVLIQIAMTTPLNPHPAVIDGTGRLGAVLIALAVAMVLVRAWRYRLILTAPLAVVLAGIVAVSTTGTIAVLYIAAATAWWARRLWQLATRPRGALPHPHPACGSACLARWPPPTCSPSTTKPTATPPSHQRRRRDRRTTRPHPRQPRRRSGNPTAPTPNHPLRPAGTCG